MTDELRKLLAAWQATEEAHEQAHSAQDAYIAALIDAAPGLFDDRDALAAAQAEVVRLTSLAREIQAAAALGKAMSVDDGEPFGMIEDRIRDALVQP